MMSDELPYPVDPTVKPLRGKDESFEDYIARCKLTLRAREEAAFRQRNEDAMREKERDRLREALDEKFDGMAGRLRESMGDADLPLEKKLESQMTALDEAFRCLMTQMAQEKGDRLAYCSMALSAQRQFRQAMAMYLKHRDTSEEKNRTTNWTDPSLCLDFLLPGLQSGGAGHRPETE